MILGLLLSVILLLLFFIIFPELMHIRIKIVDGISEIVRILFFGNVVVEAQRTAKHRLLIVGIKVRVFVVECIIRHIILVCILGRTIYF